MALLVAQTRVEAGVHSTLEVVTGGTLGALVTLVDLPGVLGVTDDELLARADAIAVARVRAVLGLQRRLRRPLPRRARDRGRQRRERRVPARRLRRADGVLARDRRGLPARRLRRRRDHRLARAAAAGSGSPRWRSSASSSATAGAIVEMTVDELLPGAVRAVTPGDPSGVAAIGCGAIVRAFGDGSGTDTARVSDVTLEAWGGGRWPGSRGARTGRARHASRYAPARWRRSMKSASSPSPAGRTSASRRSSTRSRRQGRDHLERAEHDAAPDLRRRERRRLAARARRPARASSGRWTR